MVIVLPPESTAIGFMYSKFLVESITRELFLTSDPQFGSEGLFNNVPARRHFGHIDSLHEAMVNNWNSTITRNDVVLCLGDFTQNLKHVEDSRTQVQKYSRLLTGKKILLRGNHDAEDTGWYYDCGWNCVVECPIVLTGKKLGWLAAPTRFCGCLICDIDGYRILFSHFAIYEDDDDDCRYPLEKAYLREVFTRYQCHINIHGHTHARTVAHPDCLSACMERTAFTPVTLGNFLARHLRLPEQKLA